ncbi:XdhC family protein [Bacillus sp. B15-48]|uniref:XdhC family protein n=1 Tax=Bacillus sp. B15-48 TaxID=1548601 RepID=UPI00193FCDE7|nr:XdhC family protein [Bacillus sp. B15-48]MBM4761207.1 xanthine dehydrogenase [Bacillus sp. B15-48]
MGFYDTIYNLKPGNKYITAQILSGQRNGEKAIWSDRKLFYCTQDREFWERNFPSDMEIPIGKILEIEGEKVYTEMLNEEKKLVICGAGHVAIPVVKMGKMLGFHVTVIDDRYDFVKQAEEANADKVYCEDFEHALAKIHGDNNTYFVIVTRGHRSDRLCLKAVLNKKHAYIGMISSKGRAYKQYRELLKEGYDEALLKSIHSPIGLKINAETPEEIAISIIAEIIQEKNAISATTGYDKELLLAAVGQDEKAKAMKKTMVTIVGKKGSSPRGVGTKMIVLENGTRIGTIGGGCVEAKMYDTAIRCMYDGKSKLVEYVMTEQAAEEEGMACGGIVQVYLENIS